MLTSRQCIALNPKPYPADARVAAKPAQGSRVESLLATKNLGATGFFSTSRYASFASSADGHKPDRDEAELLDNGDVMSESPREPWVGFRVQRV